MKIMKLEDFVANTIQQIITGVEAVQVFAQEHGAAVNIPIKNPAGD